MIWSGANGNGHQRTAMVRFIMPELELGTMVEVSTLVVLVVAVMMIIMVVVVMIMLGTSDKADDKMVLPPEERATDGLYAEQSSTPNLYGDGDDSKFTQLN